MARITRAALHLTAEEVKTRLRLDSHPLDREDHRHVLKMAQDEGRFGRISIPKRAWAPPGVRPHVHKQVVRQSSYVYAAVAPEEGLLTSLILPSSNTAMMNLFLVHLAEVFADYFIVMQTDRAGWHRATDLQIPARRDRVPR